MAGARYLQQKRKRNSERGKYGNEVKRQLMVESAEECVVVATIRTTGTLGDHLIELLSCPEPLQVYIRIDGELRKQRTARGLTRILSATLWKKMNKGAKRQ